MHRTAKSPRALPPRRSPRLRRSASGSSSASGSVSPHRTGSASPRADGYLHPGDRTPRKRRKMRLSEAEALQRQRSIEQVIESSADELADDLDPDDLDEVKTMSGSDPPSPVRVKREAEAKMPSEPLPSDGKPGRARQQRPGLLLPFLVGLCIPVLLGVFYFRPSVSLPDLWHAPSAPALRLERALPLLTAHVSAMGRLLPHAHTLQNPALDHLAVRELRDAAGLAELPELKHELDALCTRMTDAKVRALDLGVALWLAGRTTHNELAHALSSLTASISTTSPTALAMSASKFASATRHLDSSARDLLELANNTARALLETYTLGTTVTSSRPWGELVSAVGKTQRSKWLGAAGVGEGLAGSVAAAKEAVRRAGVLERIVRDLVRDVGAVGAGLRAVFATDDPTHPPKAHADAQRTARLASELRIELESLSAQVAKAQPDTGGAPRR